VNRRKWAKSGKDHYVDLITTAQSSNSSVMSTNKARLENLMAKAVAEDLVDGCTLSVTDDGRTLRLTAGSKPGLTVIVR